MASLIPRLFAATPDWRVAQAGRLGYNALVKTIFFALVAAITLVSCVPSTPQARIQQSPQMFARLSDKHKGMVERGQIERGMTQDAVYLAWGQPSNTIIGSYKGKESQRWDYNGSRPVYSTRFYGAYGYGYGGYRGRYGHHYPVWGYGFGPEVTYLPTRIASVWFLDRKVDSWERAQ